MSESNMSNSKSTIEVYRAAGEMDALVIKGLLETNGIPCLLKSHAAPSVHVFAVDGMGEVRVMVPNRMAKLAQELIRGDSHV